MTPSDFVTDIRDVTEVEISFETTPDFTAVGEKTVNMGQTVSYRKGITATDDRDGELTFQIDSSAPNKDIYSAAYHAMVKRKGDCYNYFAMAKVLLDRCGIDNLPVERYKGRGSHYWLLVNIGTGWYHYDPSPQSLEDPFRCFMKTDAQVKAYSRSRQDGRSDYYKFDKSKYPDRATEKYKAPE